MRASCVHRFQAKKELLIVLSEADYIGDVVGPGRHIPANRRVVEIISIFKIDDLKRHGVSEVFGPNSTTIPVRAALKDKEFVSGFLGTTFETTPVEITFSGDCWVIRNAKVWKVYSQAHSRWLTYCCFWATATFQAACVRYPLSTIYSNLSSPLPHFPSRPSLHVSCSYDFPTDPAKRQMQRYWSCEPSGSQTPYFSCSYLSGYLCSLALDDSPPSAILSGALGPTIQSSMASHSLQLFSAASISAMMDAWSGRMNGTDSNGGMS